MCVVGVCVRVGVSGGGALGFEAQGLAHLFRGSSSGLSSWDSAQVVLAGALAEAEIKHRCGSKGALA